MRLGPRLSLGFMLSVAASWAVGCLGPTAGSERGGSPSAAGAAARARPVAFADGQAVYLDQLAGPLLEAAGGQALSELVLSGAIQRLLAVRGLVLDNELINAEKALLLENLDPDNEDSAQLQLRQLRDRRGLGQKRFAALLQRNAGLRFLVREQVVLTSGALERAYRLNHGERYRVRLIVTSTLADAAWLKRKIEAGENFADLAVKHSTDASAARGGLLPPISPEDPTYPEAVRNALVSLDERPAQVSDIVIVDAGFALLRLERKIEAEPVELDDVKDQLTRWLHRDAERLLMEQLARELLADADVVVLDPSLSWQQHKSRLLGQP